MDTDKNIKMVAVDKIAPYENNPRDNSESVDRVAESIKEFGFLQPIVCDNDGVILAGHTRFEASKRLGLKEVPVLYAKDLTAAQAKAYRLADNKAGEGSLWLEDMLSAEIESIALDSDIDMGLFGFEESDDEKRRKSWKHVEKLCEVKKKIEVHPIDGSMVTSFYKTGKTGRSISDIKQDVKMVELFADNVIDYVKMTLGENLKDGDWCICTTPRRRHKDGFHFSTEISRKVAGVLGIAFYEDAVIANNRDRIMPDLELVKHPEEKNILLYDDIITTGVTVRETRGLFLEEGHNVLTIVSIRNG